MSLMFPPIDPVRRTRALLVICCALLFSTLRAAQAELPSPAELQLEVDEGPRLGGDLLLSPSLVPNSLLSSEDAAASSPPVRVAHKEDRSGGRRDDTTATTRAAIQPLSRAEMETRERVRNVLDAYKSWKLNSRDHSPWEIMHAIIAGGVSTQLLQDGPAGKPVTAVGWLCFNRNARGRRLFYPTREGFGTLQGPGLEGHRGQFLAILAQATVKPDYPIQVEGRTFSIHDLIEYEKGTCYPRTELTFKLIGLNYYLDQDAQWHNDQGQQWDIPRLIREELSQPIRGATCGGTHRLAGLSLAVKKRMSGGRPLDGDYGRAAKYLNDYHAYTFRLQNRDGSFSTQWFAGRGADPDPARRLQTTGHILEWLCYSLPQEDLRIPQMRAAADFLANLMWAHRDRTWDNGPLGHAVHALILYDERVFQPHDHLTDQLSSLADEGPHIVPARGSTRTGGGLERELEWNSAQNPSVRLDPAARRLGAD